MRRPLDVGLRLFVAAERIFGHGARLMKRNKIRIDGESSVAGADGFGGPTGQDEIEGLRAVPGGVVRS
jgi:hypothetical protein